LQLDYVAKTGAYLLRVPRTEPKQISSLMQKSGFDFSVSASTPASAVLFTKEPYAAVDFAGNATQAALAQLAPILEQIKASWNAESTAHIKCPMDQELAGFQRADVEYALRRTHTLVGDQPGLGKTPVAICYANEIAARRVLVICPANIRLQWVTRIREWTTMRWPYVVYPILTARHGVHPHAHWTVVSYDLARTETIGRALAESTYDLLILDEIHYLKTPESGRTHGVFGDSTGWCRQPIKNAAGKIVDWKPLFPALAGRTGAILGLSGTPLPNRPREAYTVAKHLCFESIDYMSERRFKMRFNPSARLEGTRIDGTTYEYTREEVGRAGELQARLRANFMVRHLKRDVMPQLKLPAYDIVRVDKTKAVKDALEAESMLGIDPDVLACEGSIKVDGHIAVVRRQMGVAIAPFAADYIDMLIDGGETKLVVFAWHIEVLDILMARLEKWKPLRIDGSTSSARRLHYVHPDGKSGLFQRDPSHQILLGNTLALGTGTDGLQHVANHVLLVEPDWVPGQNEQAIDRLDRGGQKRTVQADLFVAPGSLLEKILVVALRKRQNTHQALDARR
jgi:SWI/SNF-related matrix-associated actin-dependent regulator of chromatin subfamily A-like protein 1